MHSIRLTQCTFNKTQTETNLILTTSYITNHTSGVTFFTIVAPLKLIFNSKFKILLLVIIMQGITTVLHILKRYKAITKCFKFLSR